MNRRVLILFLSLEKLGLGNPCFAKKESLNFSSVLDDKYNIDGTSLEYIVKHPKEIMIILDGYDEYSQQDYIAGNSEEQHPNDARRKMPVAALCSKLIKGKIFKGTIVMITSRPDESDEIGGIRFKRYVEIAGFSSEQVKEYIEKYFKNNENMKNAVLKHVTNNENLVSFAHIPMLCYLLCFEMEYTLAESENPDDLPVSTTDIYAFCSLDGVMFLNDLSDVDCIGAAFVLDIISELNKGEAQRKCSDKFVTVKELELRRSQLTRSEIQRLYNSLNNEHCLVS